MTEKNKIKVLVTGTTASGKSAIAFLIQQKLTEAGIEASIVDDNSIGIVDEVPGTIERTLDSRINGIRDRVNVEVRTRQATKRCSGSCGCRIRGERK